MYKKSSVKVLSLLLAVLLILLSFVFNALGADEIEEAKAKTKLEMKLEKKARQAEKLEQKKEEEARRQREDAQMEKERAEAKAKERLATTLANVEDADLPEDNTPKLTVKDVTISGNVLVSDADIIEMMPAVWSSSGKTIAKSQPQELYDFRDLSEVILQPGVTKQISARTIQGFTQYILSLYQKNKFAGIYVYVPRTAMVAANQLKDDTLVVEVLEAPVTDITISSYDPDQNVKDKGYLRRGFIEKWSPIKQGEVANQKKLDDFVNLLNENPDRYVSAVVTRGSQERTLAVEYDVYEASPWHWFIQLDNSGTKDRQWTPRVGVINTNLLGIDDTFVAIYQAPWDSDIDDNYSLYGSYDLPIMGPKLRLNVYAGYSQFDVNPDAGPINFIGNGSFVGGILRYNVLQTESTMPLLGKGWFFDIKGMSEYTRSKVTPQLVPTGSSDVRFAMWGWGLELRKKDDMSTSSVSFDRWESYKGQSNGAAFIAARAGASSDFSIYDFRTRHSQFLNADKIHRVSGSFRWIQANERLVSAKMTSFGGMYTIRGYDEYEIVADGGILASFQYEYDLIAADKAANPADENQQEQMEKDPYEIKRAAPLVFVDYGRTNIRKAGTIVGEAKHEELMSVGVGALLDVGDNFSGAVYYGYPLIPTPDTRSGKGRVNCSFMLRW